MVISSLQAYTSNIGVSPIPSTIQHIKSDTNVTEEKRQSTLTELRQESKEIVTVGERKSISPSAFSGTRQSVKQVIKLRESLRILD